MTAEQIVIRRTGMSQADAEFYVALAEQKIREYLHLDAEADLSPYLMSTADIAVLYYQKDESTKNVSSSYGYKTESFSEGGVSESHGTMTGADIQTTYDSAINDVLAGLDGTGGLVVFI